MSEQTLINPLTGQEIEKEFADLGVETGFKPTPLERQRIMLLGWSGSGKTTFAASIPNSFILDFGNNAGGVVGPRAHRLWVNNWSLYTKAKTLLLRKKKAGDCPYSLVTFDTIDEFWHLIASKVTEDYNTAYGKNAESIGEVGQKGKGFALVAEALMAELRDFTMAGFGWLCTGHLTEKEIDVGNDKVTVVRPFLTMSSFRPLVQQASIHANIDVTIKRTRTETISLPGGKTKEIEKPLDKPRRVYRLVVKSAAPRDEIKARLPHLADVFDFPRHGAWDTLRDGWDRACEAGRQESLELQSATHEPESDTQ